jgi:hypothetical protein
VFNYESLKKTAAKLIANFGADSVFDREDGTGYNPASGSLYSGIPVTFTAKSVRAQFTVAEKASSVVQDTDVKMLVESGKGVPAIGNTLTFDSVSYSIMDVTTISPSGTDVYYELHLRH